MSYAPAVPPLPHDFGAAPPRRPDSKPPLPPLPPNFRPDSGLAAPMPERLMPTLPADMARTLDESLGPYRRPSPAPAGYPGGFVAPPPPPRTGPSPAPYPSPAFRPPSAISNAPPYSAPGSTYGSPPPQHHHSFSTPMAGLAVAQPPPRSSSAQPYPTHSHPHPHQHPYSHQHPPPPQTIASPSPPPPRGPPELTARLPTLDGLAAAQRTLPAHPGPEHVPWIRDVLFLVDRAASQSAPGGTRPDGPVSLSDPALARLAHDALAALLAVTNSAQPPPEAQYLRGTLHASGAFPAQLPASPRDAFRDFEASARAGFTKAWFKLGLDYESVGDVSRARDCFERGRRAGHESCFYRLGMAHLLGQLGVPANPQEALPLLHRGATLATTEMPQPAYVYGLILLGEFNRVRLDEWLFAPLVPTGSTIAQEARKFIERAAYLGFAPAQYKLGHAYEYAVAPFPFDPLLSVQYYSLASQQGEPEADMSLSKWFLCGAEGAFEKDEALALTFADKAARKGLASAEFAMGYYAEVGVGQPKDVDAARRWYAKAVEHGNTDAPDRLAALSQPTPQALSRTEHVQLTESTLVRRRTQAAAAGRVSGGAASVGGGDGQHVIGKIQAQAQEHRRHDHQQHQHQHQHQQQQAPAHAVRYSLVDNGSMAHSPASGGGGKSSSPRPHATGGGGRTRPQTSSPGPAPAASSSSTKSGATGSTSPAMPGTMASGVGAGSGGVAAGAGAPTTTVPKPTTFAEMGFQTGKAADKDCVVM